MSGKRERGDSDLLQVNQDVFAGAFLPAQAASSQPHFVVDVVEADGGAVQLIPRHLRLQKEGIELTTQACPGEAACEHK